MRHIGPLLVALALVLGAARPAYACDFPPPTLSDYIADADVIAVGTLESPTDDLILLRSEEYLSGDAQEAELQLNNRQFTVGADCGLTPGAGGRFAAGTRVIAFLKRDMSGGKGSWRPAGIDASGVLLLSGAQVQSLDGSRSLGTLEEVRAQAGDRAQTAPPPELQEPPAGSDRAPANAGPIPEKPLAPGEAQAPTAALPLAPAAAALLILGLGLWAWRRQQRRAP